MRTSTSHTIEPLEVRRLLSVAVAEAEPNNVQAHANGIARLVDDPVHVSGDINAAGDRDWFEIQLQAGDVVGAVVTGSGGLNPAARLVNASGEVMIACDDGLPNRPENVRGRVAASPGPQRLGHATRSSTT